MDIIQFPYLIPNFKHLEYFHSQLINLFFAILKNLMDNSMGKSLYPFKLFNFEQTL